MCIYCHTLAMDLNRSAHPRVQAFLSYTIHMTLSLVVNSLAPLLVVLQARFGLSVEESGILPTVLTLAVPAGTLSTGVFIARVGHARSLTLGLSIALSGVLLYFFAGSVGIMMVAVGLWGFGTGVSFTSVAAVFSHLPEKHQNYGVYHGFFGIGGMIGPFFVGLAIKNGFSELYFFALYGAMLLSIILWLMVGKPIANVRYLKESSNDSDQHPTKVRSPLLSIVAISSLLISIIYTGMEAGSATWSGNLFIDYFSTSADAAAFNLSLFWALFTVSRLVTDPLRKLLKSDMVLLLISVFASLAAALGLVIGQQSWLFPLLGLVYGPVFPIMQKYSTAQLPKSSHGSYSGLLYGSGGLGAMVTINIMGALSPRGMENSYAVIIVSASLLAIAALILAWDKKRKSSAAPK